MVRSPEPATALAGVSEVNVGVGGGVIVKVTAPDVAVAEFTTVTLAVPGLASNDAGTVAWRTPVLWKVVVRLVGWYRPAGVHCTTEVCTKFDPFTCMVRLADPATSAVAGTIEVRRQERRGDGKGQRS